MKTHYLINDAIATLEEAHSLDAEANETLAGILRRFHDDTHTGPHAFCYEQPCKDLREAGL